MRTVVGLYDQFQDARQVILKLREAGFESAEVSLIVRDLGSGGSRVQGRGRTTQAGHLPGGKSALRVELSALVVPGIGLVVAGGPIATALAGAGPIAGSILDPLTSMGVPDDHAGYYAEGVRLGGSLVTVRTQDDQVSTALSILNRYGPLDIERQASAWRERGWERFNPLAAPLAGTEMLYNRPDPLGKRASDLADLVRPSPPSIDTSDLYIPEIDYGDLGDGNIAPVEETNGLTSVPVTGSQGGVSAPIDDVRQVRGDAFPQLEEKFRRHYQDHFGSGGRGYDWYAAAYRFGYGLAGDPRHYGTDWDVLEPLARKRWERLLEPAAWQDVKEAVRFAWNAANG